MRREIFDLKGDYFPIKIIWRTEPGKPVSLNQVQPISCNLVKSISGGSLGLTPVYFTLITVILKER